MHELRDLPLFREIFAVRRHPSLMTATLYHVSVTGDNTLKVPACDCFRIPYHCSEESTLSAPPDDTASRKDVLHIFALAVDEVLVQGAERVESVDEWHLWRCFALRVLGEKIQSVHAAIVAAVRRTCSFPGRLNSRSACTTFKVKQRVSVRGTDQK